MKDREQVLRREKLRKHCPYNALREKGLHLALEFLIITTLLNVMEVLRLSIYYLTYRKQ